MDQLQLFPDIDFEKTKEMVEKILRQAKRYRKIRTDDPRIQMIERALGCLNQTEREIIERFYFQGDNDYLIYNDLNLGSTKYYEIKREAICIMAAALGVEIFNSP